MGRVQGFVEGEIFALLLRGERGAGSEDGAGPEDRKFLVNDFRLRIGLYQLIHDGRRFLAVGAIVVKELDQDRVARCVAADRRFGIVENLVGVRGELIGRLLGFGLLLTLVGALHRVDDDLWVALEKGTDLTAEINRLGRNGFALQDCD